MDVFCQVEAVNYVLEVLQDLFAFGVELGPVRVLGPGELTFGRSRLEYI